MKHFHSLKEGMIYRTCCPLCRGNMQIDERYDLELNHQYRIDRDPKLTLIWRHEQDEIAVDLETEEVQRHIISNSPGYSSPIGYTGPLGYHASMGQTYQTTYNGVMYVRMIMGCKNCSEYHYTLQILVDLTLLKITDILLNSERIRILDDHNVAHSINNIYPTEQTEYSYGSIPDNILGSEKQVNFPLISLDMENPYKTLERIKTLLNFL